MLLSFSAIPSDRIESRYRNFLTWVILQYGRDEDDALGDPESPGTTNQSAIPGTRVVGLSMCVDSILVAQSPHSLLRLEYVSGGGHLTLSSIPLALPFFFVQSQQRND